MSCVSLRYYSAYVYIADLKNKKASLETSVQRAQRDVEKLAEPQVALLGLIWKYQFSSFIFTYSFFWYCLEFLQLRCRSHIAGGISKGRFYSENVSNVFVPAAPEEFFKRNNFRSFWICGWGKHGQGNHMNIATPLFSKGSVLRCFPFKLKRKALLRLKGVFEKPWFCYGLMWTAVQTVIVKQRFKIWQA